MQASSERRTIPVTTRGGPDTENRQQVRAAVMRATEALLDDGHPYADLSVERIAKTAGISRTAFYFYFADKRDLMVSLAADISGQLYAQASGFFSGAADSDRELRGLLRGFIALYGEHGALIRAIVEVSTYDEEIAVSWRELMDAFIVAMRRRLERDRESHDGGGPAPDAQPTAYALTWMVERTLYQQLVQGEPVERDALIDALVRIYDRAV